MIRVLDRQFSVEESLDSLNLFIRKWFVSRYKEPSPPQRYSFKLIKEKKNILVTAPTGSGKTFSAFMAVLSDLMNMSLANQLEEKVYCIYVSPLRALNNDIYRNLNEPLSEIYSDLSIDVKKITVGIRTGDTPTSERQKHIAHPPNILVTTPESLAILLNSPRFMENLKDLKYFIIDELHELANNKRGVHLSLSIERLAEAVGHDFIRIGMGATLHPIEDAARFLVGYDRKGKERDCDVVDATWNKKLQFVAMSPVKDIMNAKDEEIENSLYSTMNSIIKKNSTTLIFTNTRSGTERVVYNLAKRYKYGNEHIAAHHGSLSRDTRLGVEEMLKKGKLKCVVSSTSLELGIDIGSIDNVIQLGSPKSVARVVQRIGRSGHGFGNPAIGEVIVTNRDDLVECSVMLDSAVKRHLDSFNTPKNALDVLCQHIVGMALNRKWDVEEAYETIRCSYPYHTLDKQDYFAVLRYLSGMYVGLESRRVYAKIWYDEKEKVFGRRGKLTKLIYYLNLGTIPDEVSVDVVTKENKHIGNIEEEFLARLKPGDIFVLGGRVYRFEYSRVMKAYVSDASGMAPTIPPWYSEQLPLTYELAINIGRFRAEFTEAVSKSAKKEKKLISKLSRNTLEANKDAKKILDSMPMDDNAKNSMFNYFMEQLLFAGYVPNDRFMLIEQSVDEESERNLIIFHSLYGRRINDAMSRLFGIKIADMHDTEVGVNITDNGFVIMTPEDVRITGKEIHAIIQELGRSDLYKMLRENIRRTEMMKRRFRHCAARSFMILRNYRGIKIGVRRQHVNSQAILKAVEEMDPNFPILKETYREIFDDLMDLPRTTGIIKGLVEGSIDYKVITSDIPSPFSHMMLTFGEADVIMMSDRRRHLKELRKQVLAKLKEMSK